MMHEAVREIKPCVLREEVNRGGEKEIAPSPNTIGHSAIERGAAGFPHLKNDCGWERIDEGADYREPNFIADRRAGWLLF